MVIGGLKPDTTYSITVAAYTTKGDGARSKPKLVVTKGAGQYEDMLRIWFMVQGSHSLFDIITARVRCLHMINIYLKEHAEHY